MAIREFIKKYLPFAVYPLRRVVYFFRFGFGTSADKVFIHRYDKKGGLGGKETRSGPGSDMEQSQVVREELPKIISELKCASILDIPCGDFFWMKLIEIEADYIGADVVPSLVEQNQEQYGNEKRRFVVKNVIKDELPKTDMVFCRDCFPYFSNDDVIKSLRNIKKSGAKYILTTNFPEKTKNENIPTGAWRAINFELAPFRFPKPLRFINEKCPVEGFRDKGLALWETKDIPDF